jgi:hypothetical protein
MDRRLGLVVFALLSILAVACTGASAAGLQQADGDQIAGGSDTLPQPGKWRSGSGA